MGNLLRVGKPVNTLDVMIAGCAAADGTSKLIPFGEASSIIGEVCDLVVQVFKHGILADPRGIQKRVSRSFGFGRYCTN